MNKRILAALLAAAVVLPGCASVQKKFTRKKKEAPHTAAVMFVEQGPYQKKYTNDYYYRTHYTLWRTWQDELLNNFGGNRKKAARSAQEAYSQLDSLRRYLVPEKAAELDDELKEMGKIMRRLEDRGYTDSEEPQVRVELEKIRRMVSNDFYYDKVKAFVQPDTVDLGAES